MEFKDPTSYADLSQGKIKHIDFRIGVDFSTHTLDIEATYHMEKPVQGSLYLDSFQNRSKRRLARKIIRWNGNLMLMTRS